MLENETKDFIYLEAITYKDKVVFRPSFSYLYEERYVINHFPLKNFLLTEGLWKCKELNTAETLYKSKDNRTKIIVQVEPIELIFTYELNIDTGLPIILIKSGNKIYLELKVTGKSRLFQQNNKIIKGEVYTYDSFVVYLDNISDYIIDPKYYYMTKVCKLPELPRVVPAKDIYKYITNLKNNENSLR